MNTTLGVFTTHKQAEDAIQEFKGFGISDADLSYVYVNKDGEITNATTGNKVGAGAAAGATTGAVVGAIAGLVVANGILPGLGTLFVAGPLAAALGFTGAAATAVAGAATGAAAGGFIGALGGLGVSDDDAKLYEDLVRAGDILVITRSNLRTKDIFMKTGATEVREYIH
jgi:hypothetical protein